MVERLEFNGLDWYHSAVTLPLSFEHDLILRATRISDPTALQRIEDAMRLSNPKLNASNNRVAFMQFAQVTLRALQANGKWHNMSL